MSGLVIRFRFVATSARSDQRIEPRSITVARASASTPELDIVSV
jgi:hypothetical protein